MQFLVVGASGATGRHLVQHLLDGGHRVKAVVRSRATLNTAWKDHEHVELIEASLLDMPDAELAEALRDCDGAASCLGHNISFKGIWGAPRRLVTDAARKLCSAMRTTDAGRKKRFVLMNTVGVADPALGERRAFGERLLIGLLRLVLPPQVDNEQAVAYLKNGIGLQHPHVEWVAVRPDSLTQDTETSPYDVLPAQTKTLFKPGQTSRINVGHFMAALLTDNALFAQWKGQLPVIYNRETAA